MRLPIHRSLRFLILIALLTSIPVRLFSQGQTWAGLSLQRLYEDARWKLGLARLNAGFELQNTGYDSDVFYGYFAAAESDFTASAGIPLQLLIPLGKKALLDVATAPRYVFYGKTEAYRGFNHTTEGRFHLALSRLYFQTSAGIEDIQQPLSPELNINVRQRSFNLSGIMLWQVSSDISFAALFDRTRFDYGDTEYQGHRISEVLNREESFVDLAAYFEPNPRLRTFLNGQYGRYDFNDPVSLGRITRSFGAFGGIEFIPRMEEQNEDPGVQGRLSIGFKRFDIVDPLGFDDSAFVGAGDISLPLFRRTTLHLIFVRDFQFSVYSRGAYFISTAAGTGISRRLSRRTSLSYDLGLNWGHYPDDTAYGVPEGGDFRFINHLLSLNIRLSRLLSVTAFGSLGHRSLMEPREVRSRYFMGLNLFYGSPAGQMTAPRRGLSH